MVFSYYSDFLLQGIRKFPNLRCHQNGEESLHYGFYGTEVTAASATCVVGLAFSTA